MMSNTVETPTIDVNVHFFDPDGQPWNHLFVRDVETERNVGYLKKLIKNRAYNSKWDRSLLRVRFELDRKEIVFKYNNKPLLDDDDERLEVIGITDGANVEVHQVWINDQHKMGETVVFIFYHDPNKELESFRNITSPRWRVGYFKALIEARLDLKHSLAGGDKLQFKHNNMLLLDHDKTLEEVGVKDGATVEVRLVAD